MTQSYKPVWPETAVFWGAGATAEIGMRTTYQLGKAFYLLSEKGKALEQRVNDALAYKEMAGWSSIVTDLLKILGDPDSSIDQREALQRQYPELNKQQREEREKYLKRYYDWEALFYIIQICPGNSFETFQLQDLFNIIDMNIHNSQGFHVPCNNAEQIFISSERLFPARNALKMLLTLLHTLDYQYAITYKSDVFEQYESFAEVLYKIMVDEGVYFENAKKKLTDRDFYLFSHSIISMNWDPILLWLLFNVHKTHNDMAEKDIIPQVKGVPMKMFHDLGHFMGVRQIDGESPQVWYPFNETVVQRVNDTTHVQSRHVRVGKFYFPHGCTGWRECPNCGKLTMYLGSNWGLSEGSLLPPHLLPGFQFGFRTKSKEEENAFEIGQTDVIQCAFCGTLTENRHTPLIMQSNFKGNHPSFIEEIQRDMRVSLEKAQHIVLMGYTLPSDDVIYRSLLSARKNHNSKSPLFCSVVGFVEGSTNEWLYKDELTKYVAI
jgi:hypothetical protein